MPLKSIKKLSAAKFSSALLDFLKTWENAPLVGNHHTTNGAIHNDGVNIPTVGYGINLLALSTDQIAPALTYALTGSLSGALTTQQQTGIALVKQWRQSASTATTTINLDLIATSKGHAGTQAERSALEAIWLSDKAASRLLEARLLGLPGLFETSIEDQIEARLSIYGARMPENSAEKLVLFSLYYNAPALIGPGISAAIADNDHARFWYEIRYNHANTGFRGIQNRREDESNKVGILAAGDRGSPAKILKAFKTLFDSQPDGSGIYDRILIRDANIKATDPGEYATQSFAAQIAPYLETLSAKRAKGREIDFVQSGTDRADTIGPGTAEHSGLTTRHTADFTTGRGGNDRIAGGGGNDTIFGGSGNDRIFGGKGNDRIMGGTGNDLIVAGKGRDQLFGNGGSDIFRFEPHQGENKVFGFRDNQDQIDLTRFHFANAREALALFAPLGSSGERVQFLADNTQIKIVGIGLDDLGANDILV